MLSKKGWKKNMDIEYFFYKNTIVDWDLDGRNLHVALRETEFEFQDESDQNSCFGLFRPSIFRCKKKNALIGSQVTAYEKKNIDW